MRNAAWERSCRSGAAAPVSGLPSPAPHQTGPPPPGNSSPHQPPPKATDAYPSIMAGQSMPASFTTMDPESETPPEGIPSQFRQVDERPPPGIIKPRPFPRRFAVGQAIGTAGVESNHLVLHDLQADASDPRRCTAGCRHRKCPPIPKDGATGSRASTRAPIASNAAPSKSSRKLTADALATSSRCSTPLLQSCASFGIPDAGLPCSRLA